MSAPDRIREGNEPSGQASDSVKAPLVSFPFHCLVFTNIDGDQTVERKGKEKAGKGLDRTRQQKQTTCRGTDRYLSFLCLVPHGLSSSLSLSASLSSPGRQWKGKESSPEEERKRLPDEETDVGPSQ